VSGHGLAAFEAGQMNLAPQAQRTARHVDGDVPTAEDQHTLSKWGHIVRAILVFAEANIAQEVRVDQHAVEIGTGNRQANTLVRADGDQHGVEAILEDIVQVIDPLVQPQVYSQIDDVLHFALDDVGRQPVFGYAEAQHPAGDGHGLDHRHAIAGLHEVLCRG
jgi:hypothetical protein